MAQIKRGWMILAAIVVLGLISVFAISHLLDADTYRNRIEKALSDALGRTVQLGHLDFSLFSGSLVAESPSIAEDAAFGTQPFLSAKDVRIGVEVMPLLLHREIHIQGFTIDDPKITLIRAENGTWNYSSIGGEGKAKTSQDTSDLIPNLTVNKIDIVNGTVTVGTLPQQRQPHIYTDLNLHATDFSFSKAFPFTVSGKLPAGGSLDVNGIAGLLNQHDASLTPLTAQIALKHADLVAAGFVEPSQGIAGIADLDTKLVSNGQTAQADGALHVTQLKLAANGTPSPQPVDLKFSINQNLQSLSGTITSANLQIGKAALALTGTYQTRGNVMSTESHVDGRSMPIDQLVAFLPSLGIQLPSGSRLQGGTLTTSLNISGPTKSLVISGPVQVSNTQLAGFDLGQKLASIQSFTGAKTGSNTTIQTLSTNLRYASDGIQTSNLVAVVSGLGSATGSGTISPSNALNYRLLIKLSSSGVGGLATQAMSLLPGAFGSTVSQTTSNGIPVTIGGTTANPTFTPDMSKLIGGAVTQQKNTQTNSLGKALSGLFHR